jgi:hypothetical protein
MEIDFKELMSKKSDEALQFYLLNRSKFVLEAVEAAIEELKVRGKVITADEVENIRNEFRQRKLLEDKEKKSWYGLNRNVVSDKNAPELYSEQAIYFFSVFFSLIMGAFLLVLNFRGAKEKKGIVEVSIFTIIFYTVELIVLAKIGYFTGFSMFINLTGAAILNYIFWPRYIGKDKVYRTKPTFTLFVICLLIKIPLVLMVFYSISGFEI